ncbi:tRNA pseudouridine synthase B [Tistlia consotensis]|uniref:tRNA pseudouridine synthase B n=1 Tax=Tistlia consotensis USBA 355 TaxID=560819 RepID=A0A1Y6CU02_9PROT|nr:tRNA pseudouridine(55) synthase TruB [Tistlia consotensis]SMF74573.1 tRNA pseudouridine synthase B [Tistlia consotensis USBA 355]SNS10887.1 tRNA pseudouridine synthase B [Tistlia consotensis]
MAKTRTRGRPLNGWLVVDKPSGMTSTDVVNRVRRRLDARKVGHGGTLDPLATGLLPLAFGEATKTVAYVMDGDKTYRFTVRWGQATDSDDAEGAVIAERPERPTRAAIEATLPRFVGEIEQVPPAYSAIKVEGQRAYDLAREGEAPQLKARIVRVDRFELIDLPDPDHGVFEVDCGKGTYMRSLARDLGEALGCLGHIAQLRRLAVGPFTEEDAISLDTLEANADSARPEELLLPVETALDDIPALALTEAEASRLKSGQALSMLARSSAERIRHLEPGDIVCAMSGGKPVAISRFEAGELRPIRVINL